MSPDTSLAARFQHWQREGDRLAGGLRDVARRAAVYRQVFRDSGRNHAFPVIAAHGALWSRGHFAFGGRLGWWLAWQYGPTPARRDKLAALDAFADAFREVNRRVCADTYANFHFTREHGDDPAAADFVDAALLAPLRRMHAAARAGEELPDAAKRDLFLAHFLDEQARVVQPSLAAALARFDWPLLRRVALRPAIRFAYFGGGRRLAFRDFSRREERIEQGRLAFDWACAAGWPAVEASLADYGVLPPEAVAAPDRYFREVCAVGGPAAAPLH